MSRYACLGLLLQRPDLLLEADVRPSFSASLANLIQLAGEWWNASVAKIEAAIVRRVLRAKRESVLQFAASSKYSISPRTYRRFK
jgi:hypothetical protein